MARVKRFGSSKERLKAWRASRKAGGWAPTPPKVIIPVEAPAAVQEGVSAVVGELVEFEGSMLPVERRPTISEGDYVALSIRGVEGRERIERAIKYAKWRYAGYRTGKVANLW